MTLSWIMEYQDKAWGQRQAHEIDTSSETDYAQKVIFRVYTDLASQPVAITYVPEVVYRVYANEWDVIMIDAPRGYYKEASRRMGAMYSAAVMARNRKKLGVTHVFLHDVDRKVEKTYAEDFLCRKNDLN
ncbi:probable methyltransferase [Tanacetum coccineum]